MSVTVAAGSNSRMLKRTLVERPCGVAVEGVEQGAEQVAEDGGPRAAGHQVEGQQGQHNAGVTCRYTGQDAPA